MNQITRKVSHSLKRTFSSRTPIVGGNWKLNAGKGTENATMAKLIAELNAGPKPSCEVYIAPPTLYLQKANEMAADHLWVSSQNIYKEASGPFTGEVSAEMLLDSGIKWTLIGHSERRDIFGETDELLGAKIAKAQSVNLNVAACIGEHREDREVGKTMDVLIPQLKAITENVDDWSKIVLAYEPVWAIGTGLTATPEQAQQTHAEIRSWVSKEVGASVADALRIQYGGSVNDGNSAALAGGADIDGFLVGGASLKADSFLAICSAFD